MPQTNFSETFLHTIPVLQWAKHLTPDEYERLSHYGGAKGWAGVTLDGVCRVFVLNDLGKAFGRHHTTVCTSHS